MSNDILYQSVLRLVQCHTHASSLSLSSFEPFNLWAMIVQLRLILYLENVIFSTQNLINSVFSVETLYESSLTDQLNDM